MGIRANYERELKDVFDKLVTMCRRIEAAIENSVKALVDNDVALARAVYEDDSIIDRMERDIEQSCLKILMMEQPVASDFREVSAALKMITDLERIGDQARDIAEIMMSMNKLREWDAGDDDTLLELPKHIPQMAVIVTEMVKNSVQSYINRDLALARMLDTIDDKVDVLFNAVMSDLIELIKKNPDRAEDAIMYMSINKYLERIGDHAVNIGQWVEYAITGNHPKK